MTGKPLHKEIRKAIDEATDLGFKVEPKSGHTYAWIICSSCGQHVQVFSTGRNPENGAKVIRRFVAKHRDHN
ncbi:hypothetical protein [Amycolatopsis pithecellobii]|uniref:Uncharacterized protein n=1 Tax=Amycolatopsis pithecellobii TaxID=664692 RepID=A0A6N7Z3J2_9PSEU|nr:hypothetical protein [Amycolatopsis pithecellobii]MTD55709.1 hypothetical protein [Amycolatopsis pithecellobii]